MAIWMSEAAMGATKARASAARGLPPSSSSRPPMPKIAANWIMLATYMITVASTPATLWIRMSRLAMCPISWASTPLSSSGVRRRIMPSVTATTALSGLRPVAKALGASWGMRGDARHGDVRVGRQIADHGVQPRGVAGAQDARPVHGQHQAVRIPIAAHVHGQGDDEGDYQAAAPAHGAADEQQQGGEQPQKQGGFYLARHGVSSPLALDTVARGSAPAVL